MTNENTIPETPVEKQNMNSGCLGQLGWFLSGAILPMGSFSYYRQAVQRKVGSAILFFVVFTLVLSTLSTASVAVNMFSVIGSIREAYANGDIPEITISHGIAEVKGEQPRILVNDRSRENSVFVAVDTTGEITKIDSSKYRQGFLLTRTELHMLNPQNGYQVLSLSQLHEIFNKDVIVIDANTVSQAWGIIAVFVVIFAFIFIALWFIVVRLMIISMIALILWGIVTLIKPNTGFGPIIITGLYAIVPAIYLSHLFSRSHISFPGLQTFFLLVFWSIGLLVSLTDRKFFARDRPLHLWTALIGLPVLILYAVDIFWQFPSPYDLVALWGMTLLTVLVLIGVRLYFRFQDNKPTQQVV
jgi:hypothetical protein